MTSEQANEFGEFKIGDVNIVTQFESVRLGTDYYGRQWVHWWNCWTIVDHAVFAERQGIRKEDLKFFPVRDVPDDLVFPHAGQYREEHERFLGQLDRLIDDQFSAVDWISNLFVDVMHGRAGGYPSYSIDDPKMIAYSPHGVHRFDHKKRRKTRIGRWLRQTIQDVEMSISEREVEKFASVVLSHITDWEANFEVYPHDEIRDWYDDCDMPSSCMTDNPAMNAMTDNSCVSILVFDDGHIRGRALLWKCDDGTKFMDRIYENEGYHIPQFKLWAKKHGYRQRIGNGSSCEMADSLEVTFDVSSGCLPYMDSFKNARIVDDQTIVLSIRGRADFHACFTDLDGECSHLPFGCCDSCGFLVTDTDELVDGLCHNCRTAPCDDCGDDYDPDDLSDGLCEHCYLDRQEREREEEEERIADELREEGRDVQQSTR